MGGGWSVSRTAGVIGAQGDEGEGREVSHGGEARTSQALWFLPTLRFEVIRHCGSPSRVTGGVQAERPFRKGSYTLKTISVTKVKGRASYSHSLENN